MQLIIISGPSGSGKTTLSKTIFKKFKNGIIINTDNYYKTGIISKILSKLVTCYFDRKISFDFKLFKSHLVFILKNGFSNFSYKYNYKNKTTKKILKNTKNIKFIIIEGIFGEEITKFVSSNKCILVKLKTSKQSCMKRVIKRDFMERGKSKKYAQRDFIKAWELFYKNKNYSRIYLKEFVLRNKIEINSFLKKITNLMK